MLGLNEAGFFDRKDGQHPITKWIKSQYPTDEELLRSRLLTLRSAAKISSNNRITATARRPGYQRVKNTRCVLFLFFFYFFGVSLPRSNGNGWFRSACSQVEARTTSRSGRHLSSTIQKSSQIIWRENSLSQTIGSAVDPSHNQYLNTRTDAAL